MSKKLQNVSRYRDKTRFRLPIKIVYINQTGVISESRSQGGSFGERCTKCVCFSLASFISNCTDATSNCGVSAATPNPRRRRSEQYISRWTFDNSRQRRAHLSSQGDIELKDLRGTGPPPHEVRRFRSLDPPPRSMRHPI